MRNCIRFFSILLLLALVLCLFGCQSNEDPTGDATTSVTIAPVPAQEMYSAALQDLSDANNLILTYQYNQSRIIGADTFTTKLSGTSTFTGLSQELQAVVTQSITFGTYGVQYTELYDDGNAYVTTNGCNFTAEMTGDAFLSRQLPAALLDASLYQSIAAETTDGITVISFSNATSLESWERTGDEITLVSASGTATLDKSGALTGFTYTASYLWGTTTYKSDVSMEISTPRKYDISQVHPGYPETCVTISCLDAPKLILRAVGDIFTAQSFQSEANQQISSAALDLIRTDHNIYTISGTGKQMVASADYQVTLSDYRGATTTTTQSDHYENGIFTRISNGSAPAETAETPDNIRIRWENNVLNGLFALTYLDGAELTVTDDFYILNFNGNDAYRSAISSSLNTVFSSDLDSLATSYTDTLATGYLTINKQTGLPTALGMAFARTHVLYGVSYPLTYQLDQKLYLSNVESEDTATDTPVESQPTPLFYQVTGPDGAQLWLLGTIHVGDARTDKLPAEIYNAFRSADALAVEYDVNAFLEQVSSDPAIQSALASLYYYQDGTSTADHLSLDSYEQALIQLTASGSYSTSTGYMRPVFLANLIEEFYLEQGYQLSTDNGVDLQLLELAALSGKSVISIESGLSQIQIMASFSDGLQQLLLDTTLENGLVGYNNAITTLYELWCQGNAELIYPLLFADDETAPDAERTYWQEYDQALITDRNATMLQSAIDCLESEETVFYAVGLAHLLGENGLLAGLEAAGYTVQQVTYN